MKKCCICTITILSALLTFASCSKTGIVYTENANDYNTKEYPLSSWFFLSEIPSNAEVLDFSYYDYWNEDYDYYLELQFSTTDEIDAYLGLIKSINKSKLNVNGKKYAESEHPTDSSFSNIFWWSGAAWSNKEYFTGYEVSQKDNKNVYSCYYDMISYSYEDLIVIHTSCAGYFYETSHNYIPKYLARFNLTKADSKFWIRSSDN